MKKNIVLALLTILVVILSLIAGGLAVYVFLNKSEKLEPSPSPSPAAVVEEKEEAVGLANPASVYCKNQGGSLRIEETEGGQRGICVLPEGIECEEWEYFRGTCPPDSAEATPDKAESVAKADEQMFKELFADKYNKPIGDITLTIDENTGTHANGGVKFAGEIGGAWWLMAKSGGDWVIVADGNGTVPCSAIEPYNFPTSMVPECWDEGTGTLVVRQ